MLIHLTSPLIRIKGICKGVTSLAYYLMRIKCGVKAVITFDHTFDTNQRKSKSIFSCSVSVRTDHEIGARRPDLVIIDKRDKSCQIIDVAISEDNGVREKEDEKVEKYQDLAREVRKMWGVRTKVIPVVVGALGSIPLRLNNNLRAIEVGIPVGLIQRCALLGSARILRKVLER